MKIQRIKNISEDQFIATYLIPKIPVIVTDAMEKWDMGKFAPDNLKKEFGMHEVQVYNNLFDLQTVDTLEAYLNKNFEKKENTDSIIEYARWFTKFKDIDFFWSDEVFESLKNYWEHPYFLPKRGMVLPFNAAGSELKVNESSFPYKGLFLSGKGGKTRLHKDPLNTNALLCQLYGSKQILMYGPDQEEYLARTGEFVDPLNPDLNKFPDYDKAKLMYKDTLSPGEIIFFPAGWFHDVTSMSDSVSITWNFVHSVELEGFCNYLDEHTTPEEMEVVRFFTKEYIHNPERNIDEIRTFYKGMGQEII